MKNTIRFTSSSLFILLLFFGQESFAIDTFCCVIGIRDGGGYSGTGSNLNDVGQSSTEDQGTASSDTYRAAKKAEAIKQCNDNADAAKKTCEGAYNQLNNICNAYVNALGAFGIRTLLERLGLSLPGSVGATISGIAASAGGSNLSAPCSVLVPSAMAYCSAGAQKMKDACPK